MAKQENSSVERWDPFRDLDWFGRLSPFRDLGLRGAPRGVWTDASGESVASPAVDVAESPSQYVFTAELPGTRSEDVHVEIHGNTLTIRGEKRSEREEKDERRRYVERRFGSFSRSFTLPEDADGDRINAGFADGVLTVEVPRIEETKPRRIQIGS